MDIQKRALYNSLRMNWLIDPSLNVEAWQVENYREMSLPLIFDELNKHQIYFNKDSFTAFASNFDTPEDFVDNVLENEEYTGEEEDHIYLLLFELWRRFETDKPCLSIFCDELDHQIFRFDSTEGENSETMEDSIANLLVILNENSDHGGDPVEILQYVNQACANDIESFLYDYISLQIDIENFSYASDLIDSFQDYISDTKWFDLLQVKILTDTDPAGKSTLIKQLVEEAKEEDDLEFNLEILDELSKSNQPPLFLSLLKASVLLLESEEDFQDLASICADYFYTEELEKEEALTTALLERRQNKALVLDFNQNDADLALLIELLEKNIES